MVTIRHYQPGDEAAQVAIFNTAAASLPGFKPATEDEQKRRTRAAGFRRQSRIYAVDGNRVLGYVMLQENGRISYPWCQPGCEAIQKPLFEKMCEYAKSLNLPAITAAYRGDWKPTLEFFLANGFTKKREMANYVQKLTDLPTMVIRRGISVDRLRLDDLPAVEAMVPGLLTLSGEALRDYYFANPFFSAESFFVLRKPDSSIMAVGSLVTETQYADPLKVDAMMPCYRLGAFGTEGMNCKRINGLFSVLVPDSRDALPLSLDLLWCATQRLDDIDIDSIAAQAPTDVPHLTGFYDRYFRRHGSFPVLERKL